MKSGLDYNWQMGQRSRAICDLNHPVNLFIMIEIAKLSITLDNDQSA